MEPVYTMDILTRSTVVKYLQSKSGRKLFDEVSMQKYRSKDMVSIDIRYYCDGIFDCDDHSDETSADCLNN